MLRQRLQQTQKRLTRTIILSSAIPAFLVAAGALFFAMAGAEQEYRQGRIRRGHFSRRGIRPRSAIQTAHPRFPPSTRSTPSMIPGTLIPLIHSSQKPRPLTAGLRAWLSSMRTARTTFSIGAPAELPASALSSGFVSEGLGAKHRDDRSLLPRQADLHTFSWSPGTSGTGQAVYLSANAVEFSATLDRVRFGRTGEVFPRQSKRCIANEVRHAWRHPRRDR
jgi:hypothetical protein